jgi:uncharacterized membrane protein
MMPFEYKLVIVFVAVGVSNIIFRNNRNWIFGYRSERALKDHSHFAYANLIYGVGEILIGICYFCWAHYLGGLKANHPIWQQLICLGSYFVVLFTLIELKLHRHFHDSH